MRLHACQFGTNTQSGTKVLFTLIWLALSTTGISSLEASTPFKSSQTLGVKGFFQIMQLDVNAPKPHYLTPEWLRLQQCKRSINPLLPPPPPQQKFTQVIPHFWPWWPWPGAWRVGRWFQPRFETGASGTSPPPQTSCQPTSRPINSSMTILFTFIHISYVIHSTVPNQGGGGGLLGWCNQPFLGWYLL